MPLSPSNVRLVALVSDRPSDEARRAIWDRVAGAWPPTAGHAEAAPCSPDQFRAGLDKARFDAALISLENEHDEQTIARLFDLVWERDLGAVALVRDADSALAVTRTQGVLVLPEASPASAIAASLAATAERQRCFEGLRRELGVARRFQGGIAGEMDKLHDELRLAAAVQQEMLPARMPDAPGFEFGVYFRSAGYVSGDTYDVQRLDDEHVGFFVADAVGHGVPAALMTMLIANGIRMRGRDDAGVVIHPPGDVLSGLNRELVRNQEGAPRFATAVYGVLHEPTGELRVAAAGHPPPLIINAAGRARMLEARGSLLGVFADEAYPEVAIRLRADEVLVIYSDGFETAFPTDDEDMYKRRLPTKRYFDEFKRTATRWAESGIGGAMKYLEGEVDAASGSLHQVDDLTALVIAPRREHGAPADAPAHADSSFVVNEPAPGVLRAAD